MYFFRVFLLGVFSSDPFLVGCVELANIITESYCYCQYCEEMLVNV
jgi:hypothetical protein